MDTNAAHLSDATQHTVSSGATSSSPASSQTRETEFGSSPEDFGTVGTFDRETNTISEAELQAEATAAKNMRAINALNSRANNQEKTQVEEKEK